jgi:flagellar biosynthesis/type III secretory pathway protein FliH
MYHEYKIKELIRDFKEIDRFSKADLEEKIIEAFESYAQEKYNEGFDEGKEEAADLDRYDEGYEDGFEEGKSENNV